MTTAVVHAITLDDTNRARTAYGQHLSIAGGPPVRSCRPCRDDLACPDAEWATSYLALFNAQHATNAARVAR